MSGRRLAPRGRRRCLYWQDKRLTDVVFSCGVSTIPSLDAVLTRSPPRPCPGRPRRWGSGGDRGRASHPAVSVLILRVVLFGYLRRSAGSQESSLRLIVGQLLARTLPFLDWARLFWSQCGPMARTAADVDLFLRAIDVPQHSIADPLGQPDADR